MAVLASWSGLGLADGTPVTTSTAGSGDTAFTTVTSGAFTVDDSGLHAPRLQVDQQAATEAQLIWDSTVVGTSLTAWAARVYVELSGYPPSNGGRILSAYTSSNNLLWFVDLTAAGIFRLRNAGGTSVDSDGPLPLDTELRVEAVHDDGDVTVTVYTGDGGTPVASVSSTGLGTGSGLEAVRWGMPATSPTWPTLWLDEMAVADEATEIGPVPAPPVPTPPPPRFPLQDRYELLLDGTWTDITGWVYDRDEVTITRGRSAEAQEADPAKMTLTLDNRDGRFSPRNPASPWYGILGRNTQIRASLPGPSRLVLPEHATGYVSTPDSPALSVTGDLDVRLDIDPDYWRIDGDLIGKAQSPTQTSWVLHTRASGELEFWWSPDGTTLNVASSVFLVTPGKARFAVRVTLDVDNGDGGHIITFYTGPSVDGPWLQLGPEVVGAGTTSIHDGTAPVEIGRTPGSTYSGRSGSVYAAQIRDGIDGTIVASPDFTAQTAATTSFTDAQGNTWTLNDCHFDDRRYRFHGEVAEWPATWRMGGHDAYAQITASGIKRRLTQNAPLLGSPMYREFANPERQNVVGYWPMEDQAEATQIAGGRVGVPPGRVQGSPRMAGYSGWTASDPVPEMNTGAFTFSVPPYAPTGAIRVRMFVYFTSGAVQSETSLLEVHTTGSIPRWELRVTTTGGLRTKAWYPDGTPVDDGPFVDFENGALDAEFINAVGGRGFVLLDFSLEQVGSNLRWVTEVFDFANTDTVDTLFPSFLFRGTLPNETAGAARMVMVGREQGLGEVKVGHLVVADSMDAFDDSYPALAAWNGENPTRRMARLCGEEGIRHIVVNKGVVSGNFVTLGDQLNGTLVDLLEEAATSDGGVLFEPRDFLGFAYRTRGGMHNQPPAVVLDCGGRQITGDLTPVDDDRHTLNDLTVKREGGSSVHLEKTTGPLSTAEPPNGVGRYAGEVTLSLTRDSDLPDQAGWRLHLGTVDEARFPTLTVNLRSTGITDQLYEQIMELDVGDRIVLTGIPDGLPPDDVSLLVEGYTEQMRRMGHVIEFNLRPESPWHAPQVGLTGYDRVDSADATLAADAGESDTALTVATVDIPWTTDPADLPFDIVVAGERMTVTQISGSSSPQTFTVVRGVNGVTKGQKAGAEVRIAEPVYIAL